VFILKHHAVAFYNMAKQSQSIAFLFVKTVEVRFERKKQ
jgi:hypothetical protein